MEITERDFRSEDVLVKQTRQASADDRQRCPDIPWGWWGVGTLSDIQISRVGVPSKLMLQDSCYDWTRQALQGWLRSSHTDLGEADKSLGKERVFVKAHQLERSISGLQVCQPIPTCLPAYR